MQIIVVTIQPEAGNLLVHITQAMQLTNLEQNMRCGLLNKTNKQITIKSIGLWSTNREIMKEQKKFDKYLKPFGVIELKMYVGDLNLDISGSGFSRCTYGKPPKKSSQPLYKKHHSEKILRKIR